MMNTNIIECIRKYIREESYNQELIGISDLAEYCHQIEGEIYVNLLALKKLGEVEIIIRDFCPEVHPMSKEVVPYGQEYEAENSDEYITTTVYIKPIKISYQ